jgi:hypothetical protein
LTHERNTARGQDTRRRLLAQEAARIMLAEGINDYGAARRLAASRQGIHSRQLWPSDEEILDAAHEWRRIYPCNRGKEHLNHLRRLAVESMTFLEAFSPRLTGNVATGAVGEHTAIIVELFADPTEEVLKKLLDARIPYTVHTLPGHGKGAREVPTATEVRFHVDDVAMELRIWPTGFQRQLLNRKETPRLTLREVRLLLN